MAETKPSDSNPADGPGGEPDLGAAVSDAANDDSVFDDSVFYEGTDDDAFGPDDPEATSQLAVRIAQIGLVVLALVILGVVVLANRGGDDDTSSTKGDSASQPANGAQKDDPKADAPKKKAWPTAVSGRPAGLGQTKQPAGGVTVEADPGIYVWNDFDGWHLWVVNGEGIPAVSGSITSNADLDKAVLAVDGAGTVTPAGRAASFQLPTEPGLVGVDFNPGFFSDSIVITLTGPEGAPIDGALIKTGKKSATAPFPFVMQKG